MKDKYSIEYLQQTNLMNSIEEKFGIDIRQYLKVEYIENQEAASAIAKQLGISHNSITGWLRKVWLYPNTAKE